jgi:hypothetical protein
MPMSWSVPAASGGHGLAALFAGHANEHGCDLFDQSSHGDVLHAVQTFVAWQLRGDPPPRATVRLHLPCRSTTARARGPPPSAS